jgi:DNA primase
MFDGDAAGDKATRRGIDIAQQSSIDVSVVILPEGKDPDDIARENIKLLKDLLTSSIPIYDYYLASAGNRFDCSTAYGKRKMSEEIFPLLSKIDNTVVLNHYVRKLADILGVSEQAIGSGLEKMKKQLNKEQALGRRNEGGSISENAQNDMSIHHIEMYILALLLQGNTPEMLEDFRDEIDISDIQHPVIRKIITLLSAFVEATPKFLIKDFADSLPKEILGVFDEAFLTDLSDLTSDQSRFMAIWEKSLAYLKKSLLQNHLKICTYELKQLEAGTGDEEKRLELEKKIVEMTALIRELEKKA